MSISHQHCAKKVKIVKKTNLIADYLSTLSRELDKNSLISLTAAGLKVSKKSVRYIIRKNEETRFKNLDEVL